MVDRHRVLLVEDEENIALGIKFNLEAEGYEVTATGDAADALTTFRSSRFDLVILDIMLPGVSGYSICESIRESNRQIPVLFLSARTLPEDKAKGFDVGGNQYLTKPFELDELLSRVRNLIRFQSNLPAPVEKKPLQRFEFGDSRVDFERYEVQVDGNDLRLTRLELELLRYLVEHEGRVISREELLQSVWNVDGNVKSRAPDQFIRRLRTYFEKDPSNPVHILTIREAGYQFLSGNRDQGVQRGGWSSR
ncbi:MAG: response regulator transcription factor [Planctomycetota bacterium]|nr:response regulator transcription factor [Planctomycetota bacterium]